MGILIRNGEIVGASGRVHADVRAEGGTITEVGARLDPRDGDEVIDATGQYVLPGFIDPHVHLELPVMGTVSADDFHDGGAAAAAGGTTCVMDFCMPARGQSLPDAMVAWRERAAKSPIDHACHVGITELNERTPAEMREVVERHGAPSFKVFLAYKGTNQLEDGELYRVMEESAKLGAVVTVHAENGDAIAHLQRELVAKGCTGPEFHPVSRPSILEGEATARALMLARLHGTAAYIVHMTCKEAVHALIEAKLAGQRCWGETCPQYLLLDDSVFDAPDFGGSAYVMSPPLRPGHIGHHDALWHALANGMLDTVGTDHCPFTHAQKLAGLGDFTKIPNGAAGIEHRLELLYTYGVREGRLTLERMVELGSTAPARIFGLVKKGAIMAGMDADLVLYEPRGERTITARAQHTRADRSVYEGFKLHGRVARTIAGGRTVWDGAALHTVRGAGRYIARKPSHFARRPEVRP